MKTPIIALLTDFGTEDGYVGAMKGRILSEVPDANIVDISHDISPFDVRQAAFCLNNSYPYFPDKALFVVVVDPGVGTDRKGIVVKTSQHYFIGPDNGVFSFVFQREGAQVYEILLDEFAEEISTTFHGRDVFAPIAAWIAAKKSLKNYLAPVKEAHTFLHSPHQISENEFEIEVMHVDHFGNLILNFHKDDWLKLEQSAEMTVRLNDLELKGLNKAFSGVPAGQFLLNWDSSGFLQIAQNNGNAAEKLNSTVGDQLRLYI